MSASSFPARCADAARQRGDSIGGTAPRGTYWVLIEYRGGWPVNGFDGLDLDPDVKTDVFNAARALRARILLIRRHGKRAREGSAHWAVMHLGGPGNLVQLWGTWSEDSDLLGIVSALQRCTEASASSPAVQNPLVLVCAHGQHDVCCAIRGRPVAAALDQRWPECVWECTHVGGDRFAANILLVPDGVYYGNVDADSAVGVVDRYLSGRVVGEYLRGYTDHGPMEQAAIRAALNRNGPAGRFDYTIADVAVDDGLWTVRVRGRRPNQTDLDVGLRVSRSDPEYLTCRGLERAVASRIGVVSVRPVDAGTR